LQAYPKDKGIAMSQKINNARSLYLEGIRDGNYEAAIEKYTGARYTQHSTGVKDGKEGFLEFFERFMKNHPKRDIRIIRSIEDGQYVFLHVYQNLDEGKSEWVTTDFEGRIDSARSLFLEAAETEEAVFADIMNNIPG